MLFITFDENNTHEPCPTPIISSTIVVGAGVPAGVQNRQALNPYSLLATIENLYGLRRSARAPWRRSLDLYSATRATATSTFTNLPPGMTDPSNYPPQNALAVGPGFVVAAETRTSSGRIAQPNQTTDESLYALFAGAPKFGTTLSLLDAHAVYDNATGQYVLCAIEYDTGGQINIDIATTTNPSNGWTVATLLTGSTTTDMPGLSVGQGNIYVPSQITGATDTFVVPLIAVTNGASLQSGLVRRDRRDERQQRQFVLGVRKLRLHLPAVGLHQRTAHQSRIPDL